MRMFGGISSLPSTKSFCIQVSTRCIARPRGQVSAFCMRSRILNVRDIAHRQRLPQRWFNSSARALKVTPYNSDLRSFLLSSATSSAHAAAEPVMRESSAQAREPREAKAEPAAENENSMSDDPKQALPKRRAALDKQRRKLESQIDRVRKVAAEDGLQEDDDIPPTQTGRSDAPASAATSPAEEFKIEAFKKVDRSHNPYNRKDKRAGARGSQKPDPAASPTEVKQDQAEQGDQRKERTKKWVRSAIEDLLLERRLIHKANSADNLVRCTIFDLEGNVSVVSGEFKKSELLSKHGLLPRDLRKLDTGSYTTMPSILVRNNSILVNLLHIRALVKADMVLVFDVYGSTDSQTQSVFMYDLEGKLRQGSKAMGGLPYEMRALEAILISVVTALDAEMKVHTSIVTGILADLENDIEREKLRHLLIQSKALAQFAQKATLVRDAINEVLEQDDDLAGMYLTEKMNGAERPPDQHSEVEMLLESYYKHCDEIVQAANITMSNVHTTEEIVNIILDANRNSLMLLELKVSIGTMGLGGGALIAALYGMNLRNFLEDSNLGFMAVASVTCIFMIVIVLSGLKSLRRLQRVTMREGNYDHHSSLIAKMRGRRRR